MLSLLLSALLATSAKAACTATINSLSDVSAASSCTTVNINGFTVPAGEGFTLSLASGTTVNLSEFHAFLTAVNSAKRTKTVISTLETKAGPGLSSPSVSLFQL